MKRVQIIQNGDPDKPCYSTGYNVIMKRNISISGACTLSLAVSINSTSDIKSFIFRKTNIITSHYEAVSI